MNHCPKVSVVIPAWNVSKYLRRAVESVLATNYPSLEIVIVDDASIDDTWKVCNELQQEAPSLVRIFQRSSREVRGAAATRNMGIEKSAGEYIAFLDADDWVYPWRFDEPVGILHANPTVDAVYGEFDIVCAENHPLDLHVSATANTLPSNENMSFTKFVAHGLWQTNTILFRRELLEKTGVFDERFKIGQDCHLWYRMALVGVMYRVKDPRSLAVYFRHSGNRYLPGLHHDVGRHNVLLISVWRWALLQGLNEKAEEVYDAWRSQWAGNAILMARFYNFQTGLRLWKDATIGIQKAEWLTLRPYKETVRVAVSFVSHGAGYWVHKKTIDHRH